MLPLVRVHVVEDLLLALCQHSVQMNTSVSANQPLFGIVFVTHAWRATLRFFLARSPCGESLEVLGDPVRVLVRDKMIRFVVGNRFEE